ncbi:MAG TPA: AraC family transcriptional regulator [Gemmatimonadaceae bacterium]|nr:AraC family transcriptional regulator [Gemmatimonadaceae bacterium]
MDPLSDVLRAVRLTGAYFYLVEASPPWSVAAVPARELAPRILPEVEHLISYHVIMEGECWGGPEGEPQRRLSKGDIIVFPHGDAHLMSNAEGRRIDRDALEYTPARYPETVVIGDGRREATLVCGFLGCDARPFNPLLASLPRVLHVRGAADGWLGAFPEQVVRESRGTEAGSLTMLTRMAELMFVEVLRRHLQTLGGEQSGWLAALRDPVVGTAIARMHEAPARPWTLHELAREAAASRSVLAERFSQLVGIPPMQYLAQWRLQLAAELLLRDHAKVSAVGVQVGYDSEAAFSRAFKRATGAAPAEWRRRRQGR